MGFVLRLIRIGYWLSDNEPELPHPARFVDLSWDVRERELVSDYLRGGMPVLFMMGYSPCRICGQDNGASELTDGTYLWPEGLAHYVADHHVRLPHAFVDQVVRRFLDLDQAAVQAHHDSLTLDDWLRMTR